MVQKMCVKKADEKEGVRFWHKRLVDGYGAWVVGNGSSRDGGNNGMTMGSECRHVEWWKIDSGDEYIVENIVRHLLGAGLVIETLELLTDY